MKKKVVKLSEMLNILEIEASKLGKAYFAVEITATRLSEGRIREEVVVYVDDFGHHGGSTFEEALTKLQEHAEAKGSVVTSYKEYSLG